MKNIALSLVITASLLSGCSKARIDSTEFWDRIVPLCGKAYAGTIVSDDAVDDDWRKERVVMHVRDCSKTEIRIPLHVGDDHSRTWVLTRDKGVITLRHDHRHEDGSEDAVSQYGGPSHPSMHSGARQNFPADAQTKAIFDAAGISVSNDNIWAISVRPEGHEFSYEMERPNRFFHIRFDTKTPVETPPDAWGYTANP